MKKINQLAYSLKYNSKFAEGNLFFITRLILVQTRSEHLPRYGSTAIKYVLETVLTTIFGIYTLSQNSFMHFSMKSR